MSEHFDSVSGDHDYGTPILYIQSYAGDLGDILEKLFKMYGIFFVALLGALILAIIYKTRNDNVASNAPLQEPTPNSNGVDSASNKDYPPARQRVSGNGSNTVGSGFYGLQDPRKRYYGLQAPIPPSPRQTCASSQTQQKSFQYRSGCIHSPQQNNYRYISRNTPTTSLPPFYSRSNYVTNQCESHTNLLTYYGCPKVNDISRATYQQALQFDKYVKFGDLPTGISNSSRLNRMRSVVF